MQLNPPPDLIEAAREGSKDAMERLLETLWPHAYRIARSIVQQDALAEDAAQEACAGIYRDLPQLRSTNAFRAWVIESSLERRYGPPSAVRAIRARAVRRT